MFTSVDKTLVAGIMGILVILSAVWGDGWWSHATSETVTVILAILSPIFVYLFPNTR